MRRLVVTTGERFDIQTIASDIEAIVAAFDLYLDDSPFRTGRTMHSLMGPVPMILDGARVRKESVTTLVGRAVRAHEMNPRARGYLSPTALEALESGTAQLLDLCGKVPVTVVTKVTERIRYSVYYERRKKAIEQMAQTYAEFVDFLQRKYSDDAALAQAWGDRKLTLDNPPYPSRGNDAYRTQMNRKADIEEFWQQAKADPQLAVEEEEENV